jgi:hypothetical protein
MRLDALARLIEAADFASFRELAAHFLALKSYSAVTMTDGWNDGGTDLRVYQLAPNPTSIAFQVTVEREWKAKLHDDAEKVKTRLKLDNMTFVTSKRIGEAVFFAEAEAIWRDQGVRVTKLDGQAIASTFFMEGRSTLALRLLGIDITGGEPHARGHESLRTNAAYSYAFFSNEVHDFRDAAIESAVVTVASKQSPVARENLEREVRSVLNFWDQIVVIERGTLRDADLLRVATAFKEDYVKRTLAGTQSEAVRREWAARKSRHYVRKVSSPENPERPPRG